MKDTSGLKAWNNDATGLTPYETARGFVTSTFSGSLLDSATVILDLFQHGLVSEAKRLYEMVKHTEFGDASGFFRWAQFGALFLKSSLKGGFRKRKSAAISSFVAAERACKRANRRLRWYGSRP